jgi:hypothetical protein
MVSIRNINESDKVIAELNIYSKDSVKAEIKNIYKAVMSNGPQSLDSN